MAQDQEIKIRTLPRSNEKKAMPIDKRAPTPRRWIVYVTVSTILSISVGVWTWLQSKSMGIAAKSIKVSPTELSSMQDVQSLKVSRHMQDSQIKEEILRRSRQVENQQITRVDESHDQAIWSDEEERSLGVQLDQDDSVDRVYRDLTYRQYRPSTEFLPDERIKARLANRKWVSEEERSERIQFIRNFIRSAYDRGYQLDIDQNLVVVGVRKISDPKKVNIDQVIDRLAKQGL